MHSLQTRGSRVTFDTARSAAHAPSRSRGAVPMPCGSVAQHQWGRGGGRGPMAACGVRDEPVDGRGVVSGGKGSGGTPGSLPRLVAESYTRPARRGRARPFDSRVTARVRSRVWSSDATPGLVSERGRRCKQRCENIAMTGGWSPHRSKDLERDDGRRDHGADNGRLS